MKTTMLLKASRVTASLTKIILADACNNANESGDIQRMILPIDSLDLSHYDETELSHLRSRISALLPSSLASINLEEELLEQLRSAKALLRDSEDAPANQRSQVSNSITTILKQLVDLQTSVTTTETIKKIERNLLTTLKKFPEMQSHFMTAYEEALNASD